MNNSNSNADDLVLDPGFLDRAKGALLGLAVGDALGTTLEFEPRDLHPLHTEMVGGGPFDLPPGVWTDDTSMALCLADSLIAFRAFNRPTFLQHLNRWWREGENSPLGVCFDIGVTTRAALERYKPGDAYCGRSGERTAGNGSLVRLAPIAIVYGDARWPTWDHATNQSCTTHPDEACVEACKYFSGVLACALEGLDLDEALKPRIPVPSSHPGIEAIVSGTWRTKGRHEIRSGGYVVDTLEAAIWSVARASCFEEAVVTAVNLGGDADSVGAVAGQFAGALWGASAIPERWLEPLAWRHHIEEVATALAITRYRRRGTDRPAPRFR